MEEGKLSSCSHEVLYESILIEMYTSHYLNGANHVQEQYNGEENAFIYILEEFLDPKTKLLSSAPFVPAQKTKPKKKVDIFYGIAIVHCCIVTTCSSSHISRTSISVYITPLLGSRI